MYNAIAVKVSNEITGGLFQKPKQCEILRTVFGERVSITGNSAFNWPPPDLAGTD